MWQIANIFIWRCLVNESERTQWEAECVCVPCVCLQLFAYRIMCVRVTFFCIQFGFHNTRTHICPYWTTRCECYNTLRRRQERILIFSFCFFFCCFIFIPPKTLCTWTSPDHEDEEVDEKRYRNIAVHASGRSARKWKWFHKKMCRQFKLVFVFPFLFHCGIVRGLRLSVV